MNSMVPHIWRAFAAGVGFCPSKRPHVRCANMGSMALVQHQRYCILRCWCHREKVRRFCEPIGVPGEARLAGVMDVTIYAFPELHPEAGKSKYIDPYVYHPSEPSLAGAPIASPSSFATLRISPAGSDARKTAQLQGDTLESSFLGGYTNHNTALNHRSIARRENSRCRLGHPRVRAAFLDRHKRK